MTDLILLCAGAAPDTAADSRAGVPAPPPSRLREYLAHGRVAQDQSLAGEPPSELPEEAWLRTLLGVPDAVSMAALEGLAHRLPMPFWRLTPCRLHLGMDHAMLVDPSQLELEPQDAEALAEAVAPAFAAAGLALRAPSPGAWFALGEPWALRCASWALASGRNIEAYQPTGPQARDWRRLLTEVQMTWHDHPVNQRREQAGRGPVNALWLDGFAASALPPSRGRMISDSMALRGAAEGAGWSTHRHADAAPSPTDPQAGPTVVDLDFWRQPRRMGDRQGWLQAWQRADDWLQANKAALDIAMRHRRLSVVLTGERRALVLDTAARRDWRFWRRFDPMAAIGGPPAANPPLKPAR